MGINNFLDYVVLLENKNTIYFRNCVILKLKKTSK